MFRSEDERVLRVPALLFSVLFLIFILFWFPRQFTDPNETTAAIAVLLVSNYFIGWADCLSEQPFSEYFKWLAFASLLWSYRNPRKKTPLVCLAVTCLGAALTTPYPVVSLAVLSVGMAWAHRTGYVVPQLWIPLASMTIGVAIHASLGILHVGGVAPWWADIVDSLHRRTVGNARSESTIGLHSIGRWLLEWLNRPERYFMLSTTTLVLATWAYFKRWKADPLRLRVTAAVIASTFSWSLIFPQHFLTHHFMARDVGLWAGWVGGSGLLALWRSSRAGAKVGKKALGILLVVYTLAILVSQFVQLF